jgi:hypothetical protein
MTRRGPRAACALAGLALVAGCNGTGGSAGSSGASGASSPSGSVSVCPPAQVVALGRPGVSRAPAAARFTTDGGALYVSAAGFPHGGPFDPKVGSTQIYVGRAATPPTWNRQTNVVSHVSVSVGVDEGRDTPLTLPAGNWWLLSSWTVSITLKSCKPSTITQVTPNP